MFSEPGSEPRSSDPRSHVHAHGALPLSQLTERSTPGAPSRPSLTSTVRSSLLQRRGPCGPRAQAGSHSSPCPLGPEPVRSWHPGLPEEEVGEWPQKRRRTADTSQRPDRLAWPTIGCSATWPPSKGPPTAGSNVQARVAAPGPDPTRALGSLGHGRIPLHLAFSHLPGPGGNEEQVFTEAPASCCGDPAPCLRAPASPDPHSPLPPGPPLSTLTSSFIP